MNDMMEITDIIYSRFINDFGTIQLRRLNLQKDIEIIYSWVTKSYASYWGMLDKSKEEVLEEYARLVSIKHYEVCMGYYKGKPIFLMEKYKASEDRISAYFDVEEGDYGMHIMVAPPEYKISGFTWNVFATVLEYFFDQNSIKRIVVEPDVRNEKIHVLNKKAGFQYQKEIELPEKKAALAFCEREDFEKAKKRRLEEKLIKKINLSNNMPESVHTHLTKEVWNKVNVTLVKKAISEFAHELVLVPELVQKQKEYDTYILIPDVANISYTFKAVRRSLDHWDIDEASIKKRENGNPKQIDALEFILEFRKILGIPKHLLPTYLEEISSTLSGAAYKYANQKYAAKELADCSFQKIEHSMTEGHPCFVANNGRLGFDGKDYLKYAPETNEPFKIFWIAGHKSKAEYTAIKNLEYNSLMHKELGVNLITRFNSKLKDLGLDMESYIFIPVHPWQWYNKILQVFTADIANQNIIFLGEGDDDYSAQQSIRTLYNCTNPQKMYTKTALSILNMGFMRGLSPYYMKSTPHITTWITNLLKEDEYLKRAGFTMLGEVATVGFRNTYYEVLGKTNAHNKMLSALWRESPHAKIKEGQRLMTMAAFLHIDAHGDALLTELIKSSSHTVESWLCKYLNAYLTPLLHCFYRYEMVFMPHGENIIMVMENNAPEYILMKDITEEVIVFNPKLDMPEKVKRLYTETSDQMKVLSIFTDVFDCFFRFMSAILEKHMMYSGHNFWELVAECIHTYQRQHPDLQSQYERYDLFIPEFDRCCLNRLQLRDTQQMLNLADPIQSLILKGKLKNPIAKFKSRESIIKREVVANI
ncbi:transcriptional regulator [Flavobacteriaceae bacterium (ex Bugula neritina AB1)]|nr:transcriptional regulator [Flavobacteriaceae bacterium (ex Bugula neritina AB1)]